MPENAKPPVDPGRLDRLISVLVDLAKYSTRANISTSPFQVALLDRMRKPQVGDVVVEMTRCAIDGDAIGVLLGRLWDHDHPEKEQQPTECYLWRVESLLTGVCHNWANAEFHAVPTVELRRHVMDSMKR